MSTIIYIPRAFGGTLIYTLSSPSSPLSVLAVVNFRDGDTVVPFRSGNATAQFRSGDATATFRDGIATGESR